MSTESDTNPPARPSDDDTEQDMADADRANGERPPDDDATNDTEARYGDDESPA